MVTWFCSRDLLDIVRQLQVQVWLHLKSKHVTPLIAWLSGAAKSRDLISWLPLAEAEAWDSTNYSAEIYDFKMENFKVWNWKFSFSWSGDPVKFKGKTGPDRIGSKSTGYRTGPDRISGRLLVVMCRLSSDLLYNSHVMKVSRLSHQELQQLCFLTSHRLIHLFHRLQHSCFFRPLQLLC